MTYNGYGANLDFFQRQAAAAGHFTPTIDIDGVAVHAIDSDRLPLKKSDS